VARAGTRGLQVKREPSQTSDTSASGPVTHAQSQQSGDAERLRGPPAGTWLPTMGNGSRAGTVVRQPNSRDSLVRLVRSKAARFGRHGMLSAEGVPPPLISVVHVDRPVAGAWQTNDERTDGRAARTSYA
jgi:hypothetical protein